MMKMHILILWLMAIMSVQSVQAQNIKDILNSEAAQKILNTVKQMNSLKYEDLVGTWQYQGAACQFKSDELLQKAGGIALAEGLEKKLDNAYVKAGIKAGTFSYTFDSDSTFISQVGKKKLKGTCSYDVNSGILTLKYYSLFSSEVRIVKSGETISMLFDADCLLKLVTLLSGYSKNTALNALGKVAEQYDGMLMGFEMAK